MLISPLLLAGTDPLLGSQWVHTLCRITIRRFIDPCGENLFGHLPHRGQRSASAATQPVKIRPRFAGCILHDCRILIHSRILRKSLHTQVQPLHDPDSFTRRNPQVCLSGSCVPGKYTALNNHLILRRSPCQQLRPIRLH